MEFQLSRKPISGLIESCSFPPTQTKIIHVRTIGQPRLENAPEQTELWVGFYKKTSGRRGISWSDSVDAALYYGLIDGIRQTIDEQCYRIRFTPRKPNSGWSAVNVEKAHEQIKGGRIKPEGRALFKCRKDKSAYKAADRDIPLSQSYLEQLQAHANEWALFDALAPSYKRKSIWSVMSTKREGTQKIDWKSQSPPLLKV